MNFGDQSWDSAPQEGYSRFQMTGIMGVFFFGGGGRGGVDGFKFFIPGFCGVGKFGKLGGY